METLKLSLLDAAIALWALFACAVFTLSVVFGGGWAELALVARYVYTGVLAACLIGLAVRSIRMLGRQDQP